MSEFAVPDGHRQGLPLVKVDTNIIENFGAVEANYEGLESLFHEDLDIPKSLKPVVEIKESGRRLFAARYRPISNIIETDPLKAYKLFGSTGMTEVLLHEGQHMADFVKYPKRSFGFIVLSKMLTIGSAYAGGKYAGDIFPAVHELGWFLGGFLALDKSSSLLYKYSPLEKRANESQNNQNLVNKYTGVINFPEAALSLNNDLRRRPNLELSY